MSSRWLNFFLRFSGYISHLKQKVVESDEWMVVIPTAILLIGSECVLTIVSVPLYLLVSPKKIQEEGFVFPRKMKGNAQMQSFMVRRKISLFTAGGAGLIYVLKVLVVGMISFYVLGVTPLLAAVQNWDMGTPANYTYDSAKIEVVGGVAQLKDSGSTVSGATTNSGFTGSTGWTYVDWANNGKAAGAAVASGGNPGGYVNVALNPHESATTGGFWRQSFTTTVSNPTTATLNLDWSSVAYSVPATPTSYKLYAFIDTSTANPTLGTEVWSSPEITGTTAWTSVTQINIASKIPTARTYTLKIAARSVVPATKGVYATTSGFDNVIVNWSKTTHVYDATSPTITPSTSLTSTGIKSWDHFTETATPDGGSINYQLSSDDGATWNYWNGSAWATAAATNYNAASVIDANIGSFTSASNKIKWKAFLTSNGTQPVSIDNIAIDYTDNTLPTLSSVSPAQSSLTSRVVVPYVLTDADGDPASLSTYEYSLTGAFAGEQVVMAAASSDPLHNGITGLTSSPAGTSHTFVWDAFSQLGAAYRGTVYVRLRANDGIGNGAYALSSSFPVDYVAPVTSSVSAAQTPGSTSVVVTYTLEDDTSDNHLVELQVSNDNGLTWTVPVTSVTGAVGAGVSTGVGKTIQWDAGTDFDQQFQSDLKVRVRAEDVFGNQGDFSESLDFAIDTKNPIVSNVSAVQTTGLNTVVISYHLSENTTENSSVQCEISGDGGSTWTVPTTTAAGDLGSGISAGDGKMIVWDAGVDFDNQDVSNLQVRIRATDAYSNQGNFESTPNTEVDTKAPVVASITNMTSQPNAGDTVLFMNGSFTESHPDMNAISVAVSGGDYGTPSSQNGTSNVIDVVVSLGAALQGDDYISKAKIVHTDLFGHSAINEDVSLSSSFKYVKPYTPDAPTVQNPTVNSLDVIVNKNPSEVSGLEYAIFEVTTGKYVQADGSLGTDSVWQTGVVWSTKTVTDLSSPVGNYYFSTKSRNSSDALHATTSESALSSSASVGNSAPDVALIDHVQIAGTDYVLVHYTGTDAQNNLSHLVTAQYSLNNADWFDMTEKAGAGSSGKTGLAFTSSGASFIFAWDAVADLSSMEGPVYVRFMANDGNVDGSIVTSSEFMLDLDAPVVSNVSASQSGHTVTISYDVLDVSDDLSVVLEVSSDNGATWVVPVSSVLGNVGEHQTSGEGKIVLWNVDLDFDGLYIPQMKVRIRATDRFHHVGSDTDSPAFILDTANPVISNVLASQRTSSALVVISYDLSDDTGLGLGVEMEVSSDNGATWTALTAPATGDIGTDQTTGLTKMITWNAGTDFNQTFSSEMMVRLRATDALDNQGVFASSSAFVVDMVSPVVSNVTAAQQAGSSHVSIEYDLSDDTSTSLQVALQVSDDGGVTWVVPVVSVGGAIGAGQSMGINQSIDWNANEDFTNQFNANMKVRVVATDLFGNESTGIDSAAFGLDTEKPSVTNLTASQTAGDAVTIVYTLADHSSANLHVTMQVSSDGGFTWSVPTTTVTGAIGSAQSTGTGKTIFWNPQTDFANQEVANMRVRLVSVDTYGNESIGSDSTDFVVDTKDPVGLSSLTNFLNTASMITLHWNPATDLTFDHYELWFGTNESDVANRTGSANVWNAADDSTLANALTSSTTISGLSMTSDVFVKLFAVDVFGHTSTITGVRVSPPTVTTPAPIVSPSGGGGSCSGAGCAPVLQTIPDTIAPATPILSTVAAITNETRLLIDGLAEQSSRIELYDHGVFVNQITEATNRDGIFAQTLTFAEGTHVLTAKAIDAAGNVSALSEPIVFTVDLTPPVVATTPVATIVPGEPVEVSSPIVTLVPAVTPQLPASVEGIQEVTRAVELPGLSVPIVMAAVASRAQGNTFSFSGTAIPNARVAVYVHSSQALVFQTTADAQGIWKLDHSQQNAELSEGDHSIYAVALDPSASVKSKPSEVKMFTVQKNIWAQLFGYLNLHTTLAALGVLTVSILWLFLLKRRGVKQV